MSKLGRSVLVSKGITNIEERGRYFLSLHIQEEYSDSYNKQALKLCNKLAENDCFVIADVSPKTLKQFGISDVDMLIDMLNLSAIRLDYGFSEDEMLSIARRRPIVLNASTIDINFVNKLNIVCPQIFAMHNFYPRPETGLDREYLKSSTELLHDCNVKVMAFIPGDKDFRGPLYEGLPTLEEHRKLPPIISFVDMINSFGLDDVYLADMGLSLKQEEYITDFYTNNIIDLPCYFENSTFEDLYGKIYTNRVDSPNRLIRCSESREYSCNGPQIDAYNTVERVCGAITMDNKAYCRYSGEIQIIRESLPRDDKVNVIGYVNKEYLPLLNFVNRGCKIRFVK